MLVEATGSFEEGYASQSHPTCYARSDRVVVPGETGEWAVVQDAVEWDDTIGEALH